MTNPAEITIDTADAATLAKALAQRPREEFLDITVGAWIDIVGKVPPTARQLAANYKPDDAADTHRRPTR